MIACPRGVSTKEKERMAPELLLSASVDWVVLLSEMGETREEMLEKIIWLGQL